MKRVKREGRSNKRDVGFSNEQTVAEAGVYLPSFIFGVVTALLLGLLALSQLFPSVAQQSALKTSATPTEPVSVAYLKSDRFGRLVELSSIDGLMDMLVELGRADVQTLSNFEIEKKSRQEIAVVDELLTRKLNDNNREFAIETKIGSLSVIYGLGFSKDLSGPDATEDLRVFAGAFLVDSNPRIARVASLAQFKQLAFERLKVGVADVLSALCCATDGNN